MTSNDSIWFRIGHALESARHGPQKRGTLASLKERLPGAKDKDQGPALPIPDADQLMTAGVAMVVDRVLSHWDGSGRPGFTRLVRAALSGAAAALIVDLVRPLLEGDRSLPVFDRETADRLLAGASEGLIYGAVVEPRLPGPPLAKGALFGSVGYLTSPLGGVTQMLGRHAPQNRLPIVGEVLAELEAHDQPWLAHVAFGIALAVIYESSRSSSGILPDGE